MDVYAIGIEMPGTERTDRVADADLESWETTYAVFMHLTLLLASAVLPIVPVLIMWVIKRKDSPYIDDTGREVLNFQISLTLYMIASGLLIFCGVGVLLIPAVYVLGLVGMIMGSVAAGRGEYFRYPMTLRFLT